MKGITVSVVILLGTSFGLHASQGEAQRLCVQNALPTCISKCEAAGQSNCSAMCEENITNQCLYAGE